MSKIALSSNNSGTGVFTIASLGTNTNRTVTLPDASGTINVSGLANEVPAGSNTDPSIYPTGDTNTGLFFPAADTVAVTTGGIERMTINSSGNVGIGNSNPTARLEVVTSSGTATAKIWSATNTTPIADLELQRGTNATWGADTYGDYRLRNDAGALLFQYGESSTTTERARIDSTGIVTITNLAGTGSRAVSASATGVLSATSDSRLKQEVKAAPIPGLAEIMLLEPKAYQWLDDIEKRGEGAAVEIGFFADQVKDIIPSAAPMGNDGYYGFYDRSVVAALTKAIQEQQAIIQVLTDRIETLEAK